MAGKDEANARVGTVIGGKYRLTSVLGCGGMGAVFAAENTWTRRPVALKLLHAEHAGTREAVERFMQEAQLASQLRHPNIVDVLDMGHEPEAGNLYIVQELLEGRDLRSFVDQRGRLEPEAALDILLPLTGALALAHQRGVVHRDIKPDNVFLARDESGAITPKLIDFGISKLTRERPEDRNLTQAGTLVGTPNYMSPEQARGEAVLDGQSDVWSLGVVLYEMLTGRVPFDAPNQNVLMVKIILDPVPRIEDRLPTLPPAVIDLVHDALARDRAERLPDMIAFADAILRCGLGGPALFERHRRSFVVPADVTERLAEAARAPAGSRTPRAPRPDTPSTEAQVVPVLEPPPSRPSRVVAGLAGAAALVGLAAALMWPKAPPPEPPRPVEVVIPAAAPTPADAAPALAQPVDAAVAAPDVVPAAVATPAPAVRALRPPLRPPLRPAPARRAPNATQNGAPILAP